MGRSICYCDPTHALAGEKGTWRFIFSTSITLPKGTKLKFDLQSKGRAIDWQLPSTNLKKGGAVIYAQLENHKILTAKEIEIPHSFAPHYEFTLPSALEVGNKFIIILGHKEGENSQTEEEGIQAQSTSQRRRSFLLYVDPSGKGRYDDPEIFSMDVKGAILSSIRILAPSFVTKNKRFDVIVRFEDVFGNLTNHAPADTLIELSHEYLRENLNWKLFVPETGFIALPNLYFNETGVYTIQLVNVRTKEIFRSSPIRCFADDSQCLFWGSLHGESDRFDSTENIEACLRHFRDDKAFNFYGVSPFESQEETSNEMWKLISQNIADFDESERFTTFLGFQWQGENKNEGVRLLVYSKDNKPLLRKKDLKYNSLKKIYKSLSPKELISIPCFSMAKGAEYNFQNFDQNFERVVEIYNAWGSSELPQKDGNRYVIQASRTAGFHESAEGSIQKALQNNCRFGFVAGGLDDRGIYADLFESDQEQYAPGLTAIISPSHSREALLEALYERSCYATTGARIIVGLYLAGIPMGKEISIDKKPGLTVNRHISGYVAGTTKLDIIEIIRNGTVVKTFYCDNYFLDFTYDDLSPLDKVVIDNKDGRTPFLYYYLRVTQADGHMAWSSPIWVDAVPVLIIPKTIPKHSSSKFANKKDLFDHDDLDDEDTYGSEDTTDDDMSEE